MTKEELDEEYALPYLPMENYIRAPKRSEKRIVKTKSISES